jgi:hypothetical protein
MTTSGMRWISGMDGIEKIQLVDTEMPKPGANQVLVKINTVSLNYRDTEGNLKSACTCWSLTDRS